MIRTKLIEGAEWVHKYDATRRAWKYTTIQNDLYDHAMRGLSLYDKRQQERLTIENKRRIKEMHIKTQKMLNVWKQLRCNEYCFAFFVTLFPNSEFTKVMRNTRNTVDPSFVNKLSLRDLGITKPMIIDGLIRNEILPSNFYAL